MKYLVDVVASRTMTERATVLVEAPDAATAQRAVEANYHVARWTYAVTPQKMMGPPVTVSATVRENEAQS